MGDDLLGWKDRGPGVVASSPPPSIFFPLAKWFNDGLITPAGFSLLTRKQGGWKMGHRPWWLLSSPIQVPLNHCIRPGGKWGAVEKKNTLHMNCHGTVVLWFLKRQQ